MTVALHVAIFADDYLTRESLREWLVTGGHGTSVLDASDLCPVALRRLDPDVVLLDADARRLAVSRAVTLLVSTLPAVTVVLLTHRVSDPRALRGLEAGAFDLLEKPLRHEALTALLTKAERFRRLRDENRTLRARLGGRHDPADLLGPGPGLEQLRAWLDQVAEGFEPVLLTGERGTGKLLLARMLHERAGGEDHGFVDVDGAMVRGDALWRRVRDGLGAATQAARGPSRCRGRVSLCVLGYEALPEADRTLLVASIASRRWPIDERSGTLQRSVRPIVTSRLSPEALVEQGLGSADDVATLGVVHAHLPALRERGADVLELAARLLKRSSRHHGRTLQGFDASARRALLEHPFEGNLRELMAVIEHAVALCQGDLVGLEHLPGHLLARPTLLPDGSGPRTLREVEHAHILRTLTLTRGNKLRASRLLGINRMTLYNKLREMQQASEPEE
jgi:DNA-binding NtrC family response regulator